jgi:hypothetical protein
MIYTHVLDRGPAGVISPVDRLLAPTGIESRARHTDRSRQLSPHPLIPPLEDFRKK